MTPTCGICSPPPHPPKIVTNDPSKFPQDLVGAAPYRDKKKSRAERRTWLQITTLPAKGKFHSAPILRLPRDLVVNKLTHVMRVEIQTKRSAKFEAIPLFCPFPTIIHKSMWSIMSLFIQPKSIRFFIFNFFFFHLIPIRNTLPNTLSTLTTPNMISSVTYYLDLHGAISFYYSNIFSPSKVINTP